MRHSKARTFFRPIKQGLLLFILCISVAALAFLLYSVRWIVLAALIGVGLGVIIQPVMDSLQRRMKIPRPLGAVLLFFGMLGLMAGVSLLLYLVVSDQLVPLISDLPGYVETVKKKALEFSHDNRWLRSQIEGVNVGGAVNNAFQALLRGLRIGAATLGGLFFVLAVALFLATGATHYRDGLVSLFPAYARERVREVMSQCARTLRQWTVAQGITMACVAGATSIGLLIIGIDYWLAFGIIAGLLDIVPYFGPFLSAFGMLIVTLGSQPDKAVWVLLMFVIIQQIESNLIVPIVMKGQIELPPIYLMTLMLFMGHWFGILGIFTAPPIFAVIRTIFHMSYIPMMDHARRPVTQESSE